MVEAGLEVLAGLVNRGEIYWANLGDAGHRPALVVTRSRAAVRRSRITVAPITRTIRGLRTEVPVGRPEGLPEPSVASCDDLITIRKAVLGQKPAGSLPKERIPELDRALRFALGIRS